MSTDAFNVKVFGCRGSYPKPGKDTVYFGGNTTCYAVKIRNCIIIFDAGTGIIDYGQELLKEHQTDKKTIIANLFLTHIHHDHIEGFPFFAPAYLYSTTINIYGACTSTCSLVEMLSRSMLPPYFPVEFVETHAIKNVQELSDSDTVLLDAATGTPKGLYHGSQHLSCDPDDIQVKVLRGYAHPKGGIYIYAVIWRGKKFVFATDTEGYIGSDQRLVQFCQGADLLVHDAQFTCATYADPKLPKQGWGHSTVNMAVEVAQKAGVKKLILTHHDPNDTDEIVRSKQTDAQKLFSAVECAREGTVYTL
ncbi:MAG: MBL fold metallo-hydrolase [Candidatus Auribacterota bacterium]